MIAPDSQLLTVSVGPLRLVARERIRQQELKLAGRFRFTASDADCPNGIKLAMLMEELGEVAQEVLTQPEDAIAFDSKGSREGLRKELVQLAALAVGWLESLDV